MASIYKVGRKWRVQVSIKGSRLGQVFPTKQLASAWAVEMEAAGKGGKMPSRTLGDALTRYAKEIAPTRHGEQWEAIRCEAIKRHRIAKTMLRDLGRTDMAGWRDDRLKDVQPATVLRDINLLRSVFRVCRGDWCWMAETHNPIKGMGMPKAPPSRKRRITDKEIEAIQVAAGLDQRLSAKTATERTGMAFLFALETGMRSGEIVGLTWPNVDLRKRFVHIPTSKNGEARDVPLTTRAVEILKALHHGGDPCFILGGVQRDALWRKIVKRSGVEGMTFHDSRAEAIWRLSKKLDVLQLARAVGHRDIRSLGIYYNESAADMAKLLS